MQLATTTPGNAKQAQTTCRQTWISCNSYGLHATLTLAHCVLPQTQQRDNHTGESHPQSLYEHTQQRHRYTPPHFCFPHCFNALPPRWYKHGLLNTTTINDCKTRCLGKGHGQASKVDISNSQSPQTLFCLQCLINLQYQTFFFHSWIWPLQTF